MSYYRDHRTTITPDTFGVRGVPIPWISSIIFDAEDIASIRPVSSGLLNRLVVNGPSARDTWSCYDPFRLIRGRAVVITLKEPVFGFENLSVTFSDYDAAMRVLQDNYAELLIED